MFGTKRKNRAERIAEEAWENLASAMGSAGDTARSVGRATGDTARSVKRRTGKTARSFGRRTSDLASDLADEAQTKVSSAADEAWSRASNALDALAGHKPRKPWGWIAVAVIGGIAVGWAVAASAPKVVSAAMDRFHELDEDEAPIPAPSTPASIP